jgi:hypothetical protein
MDTICVSTRQRHHGRLVKQNCIGSLSRRRSSRNHHGTGGYLRKWFNPKTTSRRDYQIKYFINALNSQRKVMFWEKCCALPTRDMSVGEMFVSYFRGVNWLLRSNFYLRRWLVVAISPR